MVGNRTSARPEVGAAGTRRHLRLLAPALVALGLIAAACGGDETPATTPAATGTSPATTSAPATTPSASESPSGSPSGGDAFEVEAEDLSFSVDSLTVGAGSQVEIDFKNRDDGTPHNFAVYESADATEALFSGEIVTGSADTVYTFQAPSEPGTYQFRCEVHPTQMTGDLVVQ
jgi:plastocyanin